MDVSPFTKSLGTIKKVQVIDCAIAHDCSFTGETHIRVTLAMLSKEFLIDLTTAKRTLLLNSQRLKRTNDPELSRRFPSNDRMLRYCRIKEFFFMGTSYAIGKAGKTTRGNSCMKVFVTDKGFTWLCSMSREADCHKVLKNSSR